jgi:hypothetical protein
MLFMADLTKSIQDLYQEEVSQGEAEIAKSHLVEFFSILQEIDKRQSQHKINITENKKVMTSYENNRSSD